MRLTNPAHPRAARPQAVDEWGSVAKGIANGKSYIRFSKVRNPHGLDRPNRNLYSTAYWPHNPFPHPSAQRPCERAPGQ